jgi:hypothetical protein
MLNLDIGFGACVSHVLERNRTFHVLAREDCLVFPFHEDLDVGWHGGRVSMWTALKFGEELPAGTLSYSQVEAGWDVPTLAFCILSTRMNRVG